MTGGKVRPRPKRSFGQNFLVHSPTIKTIAGFIDVPESRTVVELGAGQGALTRELASIVGQSGRVIAYELDRELVEWLETSGGLDANTEIRFQDMLGISMKELAAETGGRLTIAGNLPYNISSQVVLKLIDEKEWLNQAVLMFQKEVAERLTAGPGSRKYGILSVLAGQCLEVRKLMDVPPGMFFPRPKVVSQVVEIRVAENPVEVDDHKVFRLLVKQAFGQRRKTVRNALSRLFAHDVRLLDSLLKDACIEPGVRAENISVKKFAELARCASKFI